MFVIALTSVSALLALTAPSALAALAFPFDGQLAPSGGSFGTMSANSVAVDNLSGNAYVADSTAGSVDVFDASGVEVSSINGSSTPAASFTGRLSVAANNGTGRVYVLDGGHNVVDVFDSSGSYVCQITASATPSPSECNGPAGSATPTGAFNAPGGIAIDQASGEVYVVNAEAGAVDIFSPAGAYVGQIELSTVPSGYFAPLTRTIALNGFNGHVYVGDATTGLFEFDGAGAYVSTWTGANTAAGQFTSAEFSVAANDSSGEVYVSDPSHGVTDVFDSGGAYLGEFSHNYQSPAGTAVDQGSGRVYVSNQATPPTPSVVDILGPAVIVPDVAGVEANSIQATAATLTGSIDPDGVQLTDCHFDYGTSTAYGTVAPCVPAAGAIAPDSNQHQVSATIGGLKPGTHYYIRLEATNANGASSGLGSFDTLPPPTISEAEVANLAEETAELRAAIDPNGYATTYRFEWGTSTSYGSESSSRSLPAGTSAEAVKEQIGELHANTTYHWRVVASNANGTTDSPDHTFIYANDGRTLPDHRAYEMITPPDKNGSLIGVGALINAPDIAEDGSRVILNSIQCFAETPSCTADRQVEGEPYEFTRTPGGWQTTPLAPPATSLGASSSWVVNATAGTALFSSPTAPAGEDDWYARQSSGSLLDVGPTTPPSAGAVGVPFGGNPIFATPDMSHIVYTLEGPGLWPFDETIAGSEGSAYQYSGPGTAPILVGVTSGAGSHELISTCRTEVSGPGGVSVDGRTVFFTARGHDSGSLCPSGARAPAVQEVYARIDASQTVPISQHSPQDCGATCQASPASAASFLGASTDGTRAFFTSTQQLTDSASQDPSGLDSAKACAQTTAVNGCNLYEYDFSNAPGHNLITASAGDTSGNGPRVQGVMAVSTDGSHVYFVARGVLSEATNAQGETARDGVENLYVFQHDASQAGRVTFIATLPESGPDSSQWSSGQSLVNVTPNGRFLVFTSHGDLTPDDTSGTGAAQVFRYDAQTASLTRLSIGRAGYNDNGNRPGSTACGSTSCPEDALIANAPANFARRNLTMSNDGAYVFFSSPVGLTAQALNDVRIGTDLSGNPAYAENVYEYHDGQLSLISDGRDVAGVPSTACGGFAATCLIGTDASGANVFFTSADQLTPQDTDTQVDYYDARICGEATNPCIKVTRDGHTECGESCQGVGATTPPSPAAASITFDGPGNLTAATTPSARAHILSGVVHGSAFSVVVSVSGPGRIALTGVEVKAVSRVLAAGGRYRIRVALTRAARARLRHRHRLKVKLRVGFSPAGGHQVATVVNLTVVR